MPTRRIREDKKLPTRSYSSKQERQIAKTFDGTCTSNSGATPYQPGDVYLDDYLIECKTRMTHCDSITIKKEWLDKIRKEALFVGKPKEALFFNFGPDESNYVILHEDVFKELIEG